MSYLNRDERREVILQAAMRVALAEGFAAMTVRRIASEADVAAGQVHHHFSSAGELKALAFVHLSILSAPCLMPGKFRRPPPGVHGFTLCWVAKTAALSLT
ncbi:TetR family transcriptional regulator [Salmonella enterica subsp. enterica serovar Braenderup str. CFSAN000756]|nr:TetR family transcriptional regulator [Salmonella enterica subsp. enterica serovar Braenderup str. CFSAN000756]